MVGSPGAAAHSTLETLLVRSGAAVAAGQGWLLTFDPAREGNGDEHTVILQRNAQGRWTGLEANWVASAICVLNGSNPQLVAIGPGSDFLEFDGQAFSSGSIVAGLPGRVGGPFTNVSVVAGAAYAVGMCGMVYRRTGPSRWVRADAGLPITAHIQHLHGFAADELYAVGTRGTIWRYDGRRWASIASPTNLLLTQVHCTPDGWVYAVGQGGIMLRGRGDAWDVLHIEAGVDFLWGAAWFLGELYVASSRALYRLADNELSRLTFSEPSPVTFRHLSLAGGVVWSIGEEDVMQFDGTTWTRIWWAHETASEQP